MRLPFFLSGEDLVFVMTDKCNSNCIMCPVSQASRKNGSNFSQEEWDYTFSHLPDSVRHITITGGEPFLENVRLFYLMDFINEKYPYTNVLILTNGRALSIKKIFEEMKKRSSSKYRIAIPVHASNSKLHDEITQVDGSFNQTISALKNLKNTDVEVEIRIILHKVNINNIHNLCVMLSQLNVRITQVIFVAMEMHGYAARNREALWIDYRYVYNAINSGVLFLIKNGINVCLYNFPLCSIPKGMWHIAKQSISPEKIRFDDVCEFCSVKKACSGLFASTFALKLFKPQPITGDDSYD